MIPVAASRPRDLLIDSAWGDDETRELVGRVERELGRRVTGMVPTHTEWPRAIERVRARYGDSARIVVPGHGDPQGPELLDHTISLFRTP